LPTMYRRAGSMLKAITTVIGRSPRGLSKSLE
jgi:hypothetical protein